jgi:hypothetical protein
MVLRHRQDVSEAGFAQVGAQLGVRSVDLVPGTQDARTPAASASVIMVWASAGFVANPTSSGTPAAASRWLFSVQAFGMYSARPISAWPLSEAYVR